MGHESVMTTALPISITLLVQASQPFALVAINGLYRRFTSVHHTDYLALIRLVAARRARLSRLVPRACGALLHCRGRSLFRPLDSPSDTGGSLRCRGNNFNSDIVSHRHIQLKKKLLQQAALSIECPGLRSGAGRSDTRGRRLVQVFLRSPPER